MKVTIINKPSKETEKKVFQYLKKIFSQKGVEIEKENEKGVNQKIPSQSRRTLYKNHLYNDTY